MRSLHKEETPYTPVWLMRQAGRYMSEYRELRSRVGFLELCKTPSLAAEVTVDAVRALGVDAGIIFADILLPLETMGLGLEFVKGDGPVIHRPVASMTDVEAMPEFEPKEALSYVMEAISLTVAELGSSHPLIGFAGAPFTMASYAVEGGSSRNWEKTRTFMYREPEAWKALMTRLSDMTAAYLIAQINAGAAAVQLFDSWVGCLSPADYRKHVLPYLQGLIAKVRAHAPVIYFGTSTAGLLEDITATGADVIGVDWRVDLDAAWKRIGYDRGIQGNLDPLVLYADKEEIKRQAAEIIDRAGGRSGHIFNLGHGILPTTPVDNVKYLVETVHEYSAR